VTRERQKPGKSVTANGIHRYETTTMVNEA
jgi:hypothetical protein